MAFRGLDDYMLLITGVVDPYLYKPHSRELPSSFLVKRYDVTACPACGHTVKSHFIEFSSYRPRPYDAPEDAGIGLLSACQELLNKKQHPCLCSYYQGYRAG